VVELLALYRRVTDASDLAGSQIVAAASREGGGAHEHQQRAGKELARPEGRSTNDSVSLRHVKAVSSGDGSSVHKRPVALAVTPAATHVRAATAGSRLCDSGRC
jgi:hypothetical protein